MEEIGRSWSIFWKKEKENLSEVASNGDLRRKSEA